MSVSLLIVLFLGMSVMRPDALLAMEREAAIVEGARQEGEVIIWAVGEIQFQTMVVDRFKKKYPFMRKVDVVRVAPERLRTRLFAEAQTGKKSNVDVLGLSGFELFYMSNKGFFAPYKSPEADAIMEGFKDPTGYWASYYVNTLVTAYNSKLVQPKELPRGWEDLLDSKWKGNLAFFEEEYEWFANFLKVAGRDKGLAFMRQLAQQDLLFVGGSKQAPVETVFATTRNAPILTVHEVDHALSGGVARLFLEDGRLRFEINDADAQRRHLQFSAKLLGLAQLVKL